MTKRTNHLATLIDTRRKALDLNLSEIARRGGTSRQLVTKWADPAREITQMPSTETMEALAKGLGVPLTVVHEAAANSVGLVRDTYETPELRAVISTTRHLTPAEQQQVAEYARFLAMQSAR